MHIAVLADVGQPVYHVGDEAIGRETARQLVSRGHRVTMLTRDMVATLREFSDLDADAAWTVPFPIAPGRRTYAYEWALKVAERTVDNLHLSAQEVPYPESELFTLVQEISNVDAVLIAGGGSFNSKYGWLFLERLLVMKIAQLCHKKVIVTGQTLGPAITAEDAARAQELLDYALAVGFRDQGSLQLSHQLFPSVYAAAGIDDASFWGLSEAENTATATTENLPQYVAFSLSGESHDIPEPEAVKAWAKLADYTYSVTGLPTLFIPHMAPPRSGQWDEDFQHRVATQMTTPYLELSVEDADASARRLRQVSLMVSNRFHPIVFSLARNIPVLPVVASSYSQQRIDGLLNNWGLPDRTVAIWHLFGPAGHSIIDSVWEERDEYSVFVGKRKSHLLEFSQKWWNSIDDIFRGGNGKLPNLVEANSRFATLSSPYLQLVNTHNSFSSQIVAEIAQLEEEREADRLDFMQSGRQDDPFGLIGRADAFADARFHYDHVHGSWMPSRPEWAQN
ncbi:polysaccharide pyruvyl transferase family protein [Boudabousia marimammalium]|uniref:Polysaccharide pyruvyl transferase domain-containing protein n=1 Tax=Boudabousia marimammalium TaxID=156892 RepID=A0A1Q5PRN0_9ACTO|nr:polysaccharide pyruvyl transferase family protein [Boudabousia marimammalium]OKL50216.1 hypothetical protein BM477_02145 [Boudabousia marimammalium]